MRSCARIFSLRFPRNRRRLPFRGDASLRIAQVSLPGILFEQASYFSLDNPKQLSEFRPQSLIGSAAHLLRLAKQSGSGEPVLESLVGAVFVLTDFRNAPLNEVDRLTLWNAFSVPVYELLLAEDGALLAAECQAQEGWHIEADVRFSSVNDQLWYSRGGRQMGTGLVGALQDETCPCGRPGKRIVNAAIDYRDPVRQRFVYAEPRLVAAG